MADRPPHPARRIVLGLDTATDACSAALFDTATDEVLASLSEPMRKGHAEALFPLVEEALGKAGVAYGDLWRIAVTTGPGTFTGTRVGIAAARAIALAAGCAAVGVGVLEALARAARDAEPSAQEPIVAVQDAMRGELYVQTFGPAGEAVDDPQILGLSEACSWTGAAGAAHLRLVGSGAAHLAGELELTRIRAQIIPIKMSGATVARLGAERPDPGEGKPSPLYLRPPDAKLPGGVLPGEGA